MPLFRSRKVSKDDKNSELERKLVLAHDDPEPTFDISSCNAKEVPSGIYSMCKVMRKEVLLMHDNALSDLRGGGDLKNLDHLRVLDLHKNQIAEIPEEIRFFKSLQVLNLSHNCIKKVYNGIANLQALQTLDLQGNKVKVLPDEIGQMKSLRTLNISHNKVTRLPPSLANVRTLENLIVDVDEMIFPSKEIAAAGTAAMMKKLCVAAGIEYVPPSKCLLPVLDNYPNNSTPGKDLSMQSKSIENTILEMERKKAKISSSWTFLQLKLLDMTSNEEKKRQIESLTAEQHVLQAQQEQAMLSAIVRQRHEDLLRQIAEDDTETNEKILLEQKKKEKEIVQNRTALETEEQLENDRVALILTMNERSKRTEEILDEMEKERIETANLLKISQEEEANLRKKEVLENMNKLLQSEMSQEILRREYEAVRQSTTSMALQSMLDESQKVDELLNEKSKDQNKLLKSIETEEFAQIEAFHVLQMQRDAKHQRINNQIELLEKELQELSFLEMERKEGRKEEEMKNLETNRQMLIDLFMQLIEERQKREEVLAKRLVELGERREGEIEDYWLIQFQRLMDKKPETLILKEHECDENLAEVLTAANAEDYVANFVRNEITWEMLRDMKDEDLKQIGIHEYGIRWQILKAVQMRINEEERANEKEHKLNEKTEPTAASSVAEDKIQAIVPSAPPLDSVEVNLESACVICMAAKRDVIFLTCGHVCCCAQCSTGLIDCPMCRQHIEKTVRMFMV